MNISENDTLRAMNKLADFERSNYQKLRSLEEALDHLLEAYDEGGYEKVRVQRIFKSHTAKLMEDGKQALQIESEEQCLYIARALNAILDSIDEGLLGRRIEELEALRASLANKWREVKPEPSSFSLKDWIADTKEHMALTGVTRTIIEEVFRDIEKK